MDQIKWIMSLPKEMDALVLKGVRDFAIETVAVPQPDADEVICKVDTTYICGPILILSMVISLASGQSISFYSRT